MKHYTTAGNDGKSQGNDYKCTLKGGITASIIRGADGLWNLSTGTYEHLFVHCRDALEKLRRIAGTRKQS